MEVENNDECDLMDMKFCCSSILDDDDKYPNGISSNRLIELSGDSESTLKWTTMEQTLDYEGIDTMAIPISNEAYKNLELLRQESLLCFNNPPPIEEHELTDWEDPFASFKLECLYKFILGIVIFLIIPYLISDL